MNNPLKTLLKSITAAALGLSVLSSASRLEAQSLTVTTLHRFSASDGTNPYYGLTQAPSGALYGTCVGIEEDGKPGGSLFGMNPDGTGFTVIHTFSPTESEGAFNTGGANPLDGPLLVDGMFYGVTEEGGTGAYGVMYRMATNGANYTVLANFGSSTFNVNTDVEYQYAGIAQGSDGLLYGEGGCNGVNNWDTQIYRMTTNYTSYANVHYFTSSPASGGGNFYTPLFPSPDGTLYGATGGDSDTAGNNGIIFQLTTGETLTTLHAMSGNDGTAADSALIEDSSGTLYGTASSGGAKGYGTLFRISTNGANFTVIHTFGTNTDGKYPIGRLLLASDGNLYGNCEEGGTNGFGTVFRMATNGANYQVLYSFTGTFTATGDHGYPNGCMIEASNGMIYGMCADVDYDYDMPYPGNGTIFELNAGLSTATGTGIQGITRVYASPTNLSSVSWAVTFGAALTGLNATNFQLAASGLTGSPAITSVTGSGTNWTVTASTGAGAGTLQLNLTNAAGLSLALTNTLPFAGQSYAIDLVPPTISIGAPSVTITNTGAVSYTVTYADANFNASTLATGNITVNSTGTAAAGMVAGTGTGTTRTVTLSNLTGNGSLGISIAAGTASDTAGNLAPAAGPSATFQVDNTAPTINISAPSASLTTTGPVTFTVTYADANFNASTLASNNITLNSTGTASAGGVGVTGSGTNWTVTLSSISGQGTLGISIAAGTASDLAGNLAPAAGPSATFTAAIVPLITVQPAAQSAPALGNAAFSVTATGTAPLVYQWSKDGVVLTTATNFASLNLTNVNRASVGYYSVTVSNEVGLVTSTNVLLRVLIPQKFSQVLQPKTSVSPTFQALFQDTNGTVATLWYATNFFQMLGSTNLPSDWEPVSGTMSLTNGFILFQDYDPTNVNFHPYRFYRVEEQ